jgi:hypothetical protein
MKKFLIGSAPILAGLLGTFSAFAGDGASTGSIVPVASSTLLADMVSYVPSLFNDLFPVIALVLGVLFAFWVITKVVGLIAGRIRTGGRK